MNQAKLEVYLESILRISRFSYPKPRPRPFDRRQQISYPRGEGGQVLQQNLQSRTTKPQVKGSLKKQGKPFCMVIFIDYHLEPKLMTNRQQRVILHLKILQSVLNGTRLHRALKLGNMSRYLSTNNRTVNEYVRAGTCDGLLHSIPKS